jgi:hypothetical protein
VGVALNLHYGCDRLLAGGSRFPLNGTLRSTLLLLSRHHFLLQPLTFLSFLRYISHSLTSSTVSFSFCSLTLQSAGYSLSIPTISVRPIVVYPKEHFLYKLPTIPWLLILDNLCCRSRPFILFLCMLEEGLQGTLSFVKGCCVSPRLRRY